MTTLLLVPNIRSTLEEDPMPERRYYLLLGFILVFSLLLSACEGTDTPLAEEATATKEVEEVEETEEVEEIEEEPVILRVGWLTPIDCWSPWVCESIWTYGDLWGDTYFGKGPNCEPVPTRILDSWELSEDGKTWTLNVAEGVTFSNGEICDAQAAAGQLEWQASNPALADWYSVTAQLASIEILDEFTAKLNTNSPTTLFANVEGNFITLLPPSVYQNMSEEETFTFDWYPPIGTGPYIVTDWEQGSYIILEARPDYHRGKPPIDRIVVQIYSNFGGICELVRIYFPIDEVNVSSQFLLKIQCR